MQKVTLFEVVEKEVMVCDRRDARCMDYRAIWREDNKPDIAIGLDTITVPIHKVFRHRKGYAIEENLVAFDPAFEEIFNAPFAAKAEEAMALAGRRVRRIKEKYAKYWSRSFLIRFVLSVEGKNHPLNKL